MSKASVLSPSTTVYRNVNVVVMFPLKYSACRMGFREGGYVLEAIYILLCNKVEQRNERRVHTHYSCENTEGVRCYPSHQASTGLNTYQSI